MGSRLEKNSTEVRKRIESHVFEDEQGEEYNGSKFGGFTEYMRRKKIKLQNLDAELRSQSSNNAQVFRGIVVHVNGYTQPSLRDLHTLIVSHGGGFLQYLDGKTAVTHVIASNLTPKKKVEFAKYRIVKPAWVVDNVKAGRVLPWESYRAVDEGVKQKVLTFDGGKVISQSNTQRRSYREQSDTSWYTSQLRSVAQDVVDEEYKYPVASPDAEKAEATARATPHPEPTDVEDFDFQDDGLLVGTTLLDKVEAARRPQGNNLNESIPEDEMLDEQSTNSDEDEPRSANAALNHILLAEEIPIHQGQTGEDAMRQSSQKKQLSAEEHNAILLSNPHLAKSSTANPDFINQYYRESRLHHLSIWKAELKVQLQARAAEKSASQKGRHNRVPGSRRYIMHIDFDSFFAAVSLRKNPHLIDKPVAIAHGSGPGSEIASCNYPARKYGIKNGMWMKSALQLCPDIKVLPYDYAAYEEASRQFYDSILAIDGIVRSISIDEALLDVSQQCIEAGGSDGTAMQEGSVYREQNKASELAQKLRELVKDKTGCDVSVGIGNNILLAKVALRKAKPAGQHLIKPEEVLDFVGELPVTDLPGVAYSIGSKLEEIGIKFVKDIRSLTKERLINTLGPKTGEKVWDYSRGIDRTEVGEQVVRKSVSAEINWGIRFINQQQAEEFVQSLCDELHKRLLEQAVKGRQLTMKIMRKAVDAGMDPPKNLGHGKCDTFNKSVVLGVATNDKAVLGKEAISVLRGYGFPPGELRGLGVQMQKLEPLRPLPVTTPATHDSGQRRLQFKKPEPIIPVASKPPLSASKQHFRDSPTPRDVADPIEDIRTPKKPAAVMPVTAALGTFTADSGGENQTKLLNISGTQFVLPTQVDPSVLAELPSDIRSKLARESKRSQDPLFKRESLKETTIVKSRSASPFLIDDDEGLPSQSQLDPEILAALPEDVRAEVLSHYNRGRHSSLGSSTTQKLLPQSPKKLRVIPPSKKLVLTPTKKRKVSTLLGRSKSKTNTLQMPTLTQSNFVSLAKGDSSDNRAVMASLNDVSESFLDELPEDIRFEILAEQKRQRLQSKSGLSLGGARKRGRNNTRADAETFDGQTKLVLPPRPTKPTFTSRKLSTLPELRNAMSTWVKEFSTEDEEGPFDDDVAALVQYLQKVVTSESDMAKALEVVDWIVREIEEQEPMEPLVSIAWKKAVTFIQDGVQAAIRERGLPPVDFVDR